MPKLGPEMLTLSTHHGAGYILRRNGLLKHKNNMF